MKPCNRCGLPIRFRKDGSGRWVALNLDGSDHLDTCKAKRGERADAIQGKTITGERFEPLPCADVCMSPPWDDCDCPHYLAWLEREEARLAADMLGARLELQ